MKWTHEHPKQSSRRPFGRRPSAGRCDSLRSAIGRDELELHYQPVVDIASDLVVGLEALLRWRHPTEGLLAAGAFIPEAEGCGLIGALDDWVLDRAAAQIAAWEDDVLIAPGFRVAVNVSGAEFADDSLIRRVVNALRTHGADPECLTVELTETVDLPDLPAAHRNVRALQQLGVHVGLDDFGAEYATFQRLRALPFDLVKLDRDVTRSAGSPIGAAVVQAIVGLGSELGLGVIAEGIETAAQASVAAELGCTLAQGYWWSAARPPDEITSILQSGTGLSEPTRDPGAGVAEHHPA